MIAGEWLKEAEEWKEEMMATRRYLHMHPELGFELHNTVEYVKKKLKEMGYQPQICGKSGVIAEVGKKTVDTIFLIRADMDALPLGEETGLDYASTNQYMHACGHDMHTAMLLGAAGLLKKHEEEIEGCVRLMFQPAEELLEGAKDMISAGVLSQPKPAGAMMIHVMTGVPYETGTVIVSAPGVSAPAADYFEIRIKGVGCHGSTPSEGIDPLNAAAHILIALQEIHARELAISDKAALTIGMMQAGNAPNVIPDEVVMKGSLRAYDESLRSYIKERVQTISADVARAFRAEAGVRYISGCPTLVNHSEICHAIERYAEELLGDRMISLEKMNAKNGGMGVSKTAGSEDFAYVSQKIPSVMLALAAGDVKDGYQYPLHHPKVTFDEDALYVGSAVYAYMAFRWLQERNHP